MEDGAALTEGILCHYCCTCRMQNTLITTANVESQLISASVTQKSPSAVFTSEPSRIQRVDASSLTETQSRFVIMKYVSAIFTVSDERRVVQDVFSIQGKTASLALPRGK